MGACVVSVQRVQLLLHKAAAVDGWEFLSSIPEKGQ